MTGLNGLCGVGFRSLRLALLTSLFASLLASACFASSARASDRVYWANDNSPNRISFANLDGSGGDDLNTRGATSGEPRGVAITWRRERSTGRTRAATGSPSPTSTEAVGRRPQHRGRHGGPPERRGGVPGGGKIYWANEFGDRISFTNLDNTGGGDLRTTGATVNVPIGPAVDPEAGRIYWANANPEDKISFANLDGSGGADLNTTGATVDNPHGVAVDPVTARIYWANVWGDSISYANLNGAGGGDLNTNGATVSSPVGVAIDPSARKIYWGNEAGNKISFANLDGQLAAATLSRPAQRPRVHGPPRCSLTPSGSGVPTITGGSTAGSVLTCSQGFLVAGHARLLPLPRAAELRLCLVVEWHRYLGREREHIHGHRVRRLSLPGDGVQPRRQRIADERGARRVSQPGTYPRPGGATPLRVPLVPEFSKCTNPDTTHVAPLASGSCSNPALESALLTTSSQGRGGAFARLDVQPGNPVTPADEADVAIAASATRRPRRELELGLHRPVAHALDDAHHGPGERAERGRCRNVTGLRLLAAGRLRGDEQHRHRLELQCQHRHQRHAGPGFRKRGQARRDPHVFARTDRRRPRRHRHTVRRAPAHPHADQADEHPLIRQGVFAP